jgi:hypothetical protein
MHVAKPNSKKNTQLAERKLSANVEITKSVDDFRAKVKLSKWADMVVDNKKVSEITKEMLEWFTLGIKKIPFAYVNLDRKTIQEILGADVLSLSIEQVKTVINILSTTPFCNEMDFDKYMDSREVFETLFQENETVEAQMNQMIGDYQNSLIKEYDPKTWNKIK